MKFISRLVTTCLVLLACHQLELHATSQSIEFIETTRDNGLRIVVAEDHVAPVVSIAVNYEVGSRDERRGRTGFAHLFEHMMFEGSENVGDGEHVLLIGNNGGDRRINFLLNRQILGVEIDKLHGPSFPPELWGVPLS